MLRDRPFQLDVLDELLTSPRAALVPSVSQHPDERLGEERLRRFGKEQTTGDGQLVIHSQPPRAQEARWVRRPNRDHVALKKRLFHRIQRYPRWTGLVAGLTLVIEKLLPLGETELPILVANSEEDFVLLVGVNRVAGLDLEDKQLVEASTAVDALDQLRFRTHRRRAEVDIRLKLSISPLRIAARALDVPVGYADDHDPAVRVRKADQCVGQVARRDPRRLSLQPLILVDSGKLLPHLPRRRVESLLYVDRSHISYLQLLHVGCE